VNVKFAQSITPRLGKLEYVHTYIKDIATRTKVSIQTVPRVINNDANVNAEFLMKV